MLKKRNEVSLVPDTASEVKTHLTFALLTTDLYGKCHVMWRPVSNTVAKANATLALYRLIGSVKLKGKMIILQLSLTPHTQLIDNHLCRML